MQAVQRLMLPPLAARTDMVRPSVFDGRYSYEKVVLVCRGILFLFLKDIVKLDLRADKVRRNPHEPKGGIP
ncbi:MAG: hypothetical protein ABFD90_03130 [Phycisphaerales bacterium]